MSGDYRSKLAGSVGYGIEEHASDDGIAAWRDGHVFTPHGAVVVYSEDATDRREGYTNLRFAHDGYVHTRPIQGGMSRRALTLAAGRFAREVATR